MICIFEVNWLDCYNDKRNCIYKEYYFMSDLKNCDDGDKLNVMVCEGDVVGDFVFFVVCIVWIWIGV